MEQLFVCLGLGLLVLPVAALLWLASISGRIQKMEDRVARLESETRYRLRGSIETAGPAPTRPEPAVGLTVDPSRQDRPNVVVPERETPAPAVTAAMPPVVQDVPLTQPRHLFARSTSTVPPAPGLPPEPAEELSLEERLGARMFVWIGAVALALAGTYLVKYTFDRGLISPLVRVVAGSIFGLGLLGVGEFLRTRTASIAQGVTAAGIADLFACLLAATNLYGLISPMTGFVLMAINTALAVVLSLRQGPFVAGLGLVGGFMTPVLIHTGEVHVSLFIYLFVLELGLGAVTYKRHWEILTAITLVAGSAWAMGWLFFLYEPPHGPGLGLFVLATAVLFVVAGQVRAEGPDRSIAGNLISWLAVGLGIIMAATHLGVSHFSNLEWAYMGMLGAGCIVLGRLRPRMEAAAWLAAVVSLAMLVGWGLNTSPDPQRFRLILLCLGGLYALGAYAAMLGSQEPQRWMWLSSMSSLAFYLAGYALVKELPPQWTWAQIGIALAALWVVGSIVPWRQSGRRLQWAEALETSVTAAAVFLGLAIYFGLTNEWIGVAWAGELVAVAIAANWLRLQNLQALVVGLAVLVLIRLFNPGVFGYPLSDRLLANWLMYGYGLPAVAFAAGAACLGAVGDKRVKTALEGCAIAAAMALITAEVRQYFHPGHIDANAVAFNEWGCLSTAWIGCGCGLLAAAGAWRRDSLVYGGRIVLGLGVVVSILIQCLVQNPIGVHYAVGESSVVNWLLFSYGMPAILLVVAAGILRSQGDVHLARLIGGCGLLLVFVLVSLEVRQAFQGTFLDGSITTQGEKYAYSAAWIVLGAVLLAMGVLTEGVVLRYASLLVILLAVGKVFLFDTAHLKDLYRVGSFLGLGVSLLVLAYVYQRFVFRRGGDARGG